MCNKESQSLSFRFHSSHSALTPNVTVKKKLIERRGARQIRKQSFKISVIMSSRQDFNFDKKITSHVELQHRKLIFDLQLIVCSSLPGEFPSEKLNFHRVTISNTSAQSFVRSRSFEEAESRQTKQICFLLITVWFGVVKASSSVGRIWCKWTLVVWCDSKVHQTLIETRIFRLHTSLEFHRFPSDLKPFTVSFIFSHVRWWW